MPSTASGRRTVSVTVQQMTQTKGASNAPVETWTTLRTVYASKEDLLMNDSREQLRAGQLSARMETAWGLPYTADMDPNLVDVARVRRLLVGTRVYDITRGTVDDLKKGVQLITLAKVG